MPAGHSDNDTDNRRSFRCPGSTSGEQAELQIGQQRVPVRLYDQSAGGFSVTAPECPEVSRGKVIQLRVGSAVSEVRVVYVKENGDQPQRRPTYRIGLQRLKDLASPEEEEPAHRGWLQAILGRVLPRHQSADLRTGLVLAAVVVCGPLVLTAIFKHFNSTSPEPAVAWLERVAEQTGSAAVHVASDGPAGAGVAGPASNRASDWVTIARLPGASVLLAPSVVQELALTDAQQQQIRQIVDRTAEVFQQLDVSFHRMSREEQSRKQESLLEAAREEAVNLLTPEQRLQFQAQLARARQP